MPNFAQNIWVILFIAKHQNLKRFKNCGAISTCIRVRVRVRYLNMDTDPNPATRMNADPNPQPCFSQLLATFTQCDSPLLAER
jgi:hypothetical protein